MSILGNMMPPESKLQQFPTDLPGIEERLKSIQPEKYGRTRNFKNGAVTRLSPYISRGVISTGQVFEHILNQGHDWDRAEKLIQELCWRDYWQQVWIELGEGIFQDIRHPQEAVVSHEIPEAIVHAATGIEAVDSAIREFYETGYLHNHMRMYIASICTNLAGSHWSEPAKWMYAHLLDGDLASNTLSWQWVAGTFSNKKYYANQENINKYFDSTQRQTFLDVSYSDLTQMSTPEVLSQRVPFNLNTKLPESDPCQLDPQKKTLIYNYYNLDPYWYREEDVQRVLLLEPDHFDAYPVAQHCIDFACDLADNIPGIIRFVGSFSDLSQKVPPENIVFREHPTNRHYRGTQEERPFIASVTGFHRSFFQFWKKVKREVKP